MIPSHWMSCCPPEDVILHHILHHNDDPPEGMDFCSATELREYVLDAWRGEHQEFLTYIMSGVRCNLDKLISDISTGRPIEPLSLLMIATLLRIPLCLHLRTRQERNYMASCEEGRLCVAVMASKQYVVLERIPVPATPRMEVILDEWGTSVQEFAGHIAEKFNLVAATVQPGKLLPAGPPATSDEERARRREIMRLTCRVKAERKALEGLEQQVEEKREVLSGLEHQITLQTVLRQTLQRPTSTTAVQAKPETTESSFQTRPLSPQPGPSQVKDEEAGETDVPAESPEPADDPVLPPEAALEQLQDIDIASIQVPTTRGKGKGKGIGKRSQKDTKPAAPPAKKSKSEPSGSQQLRAPKVEGKCHACKYCEKTFPTVSNLNRHVKGVHSQSYDHKCEECDAAYMYKSELEHHVRVIHGGEGIFACEKCGKKYSSKQALERHSETHSGQMFACMKCGEKFNSSYKRYVHMKKHD